MKLFKKIVICLTIVITSLVGIFYTNYTYADDTISYGIGVSPMTEKVILNPGETYTSSFTVTNPSKNNSDFSYIVRVSPFFATEDYKITYEEIENYNQIVDWVTLETTSGTLSQNDTNEIKFRIDVPQDAPAGGQYVAIIVQSGEDDSSNSSNNGIQIAQAMGIAHTVFAEINGSTRHDGEIIYTTLSGFMLSGKITGTTSIKNTGNVHGTATYKLQIFPLFSDEEVYTNEEDPETSLVLPNRTLHHETVWNETPMIGIFNAIYTVEYEGITEQVSRLVIICPLWLIFIVILVIVALVIWLVIRIKMHKKSQDE